jgi:hypothetical protein
MDNFKVIYKILKTLEKAMDCDEFDISLIAPAQYDITRERWIKIIENLLLDGYVRDVFISKTLGGTSIKAENITITNKGLEYLAENSIMKKLANAAKGVIDIVT